MHNEKPDIAITLLETIREEHPDAGIRDILFETARARPYIDDYKGRHGDEPKDLQRGKADFMLMKSLLAMAALQQGGGFNDAPQNETTNRLKIAAGAPYGKKKWLAKSYEMNKYEVLAVDAYSDANKGVKYFTKEVDDGEDINIINEANPQYMGEAEHWGPYKNGWNALTSAMEKIPTLGQLGLTMTTYRTSREHQEMKDLAKLSPGVGIAHGIKEMNMGQQHYISTAVTYNSHWSRAPDVGGMIGITGTSGRYINPFGLQGFLDGGEILYPPETYTQYKASNPSGYVSRSGKNLPIHRLQEVGGPDQITTNWVEDSAYKPFDARKLEDEKTRLIREIEGAEIRRGPGSVKRARKNTGIKGPMRYLSLSELKTLLRQTIVG